MAKLLKIEQGEWVVVCDGKKALWLENVGDAVFPNLATKQVQDHADQPTHEQGTDAPGRALNSVGAVRSAVEQTDWHELAERAFLDQLARRLDRAVAEGHIKRVVVVAPPRALGVLRQNYTPRLRQAVRAEIDKDLVRMPVHEIEKHLVPPI